MARYNLSVIEADSTVIPAITSASVLQNNEHTPEALSGEAFARFVSRTSADPRANFTTRALAIAFGNLGAGKGISIATLTAGLKLFAQQRAVGSTRQSGSNHIKYTGTAGIIVPRNLTVDVGGDAELTYECVFLSSDGTSEALSKTASTALPSGITDAERFTIGTVDVGGNALSQITNISVDFGITLGMDRTDSDILSTYVDIETWLPTITIRGNDAEIPANTLSLGGDGGTHANTEIFLRKRASKGDFVSDITAEHVKITMDGLASVNTLFDASGQSIGEWELTMNGVYDGTNDPIVIDESIAIT